MSEWTEPEMNATADNLTKRQKSPADKELFSKCGHRAAKIHKS